MKKVLCAFLLTVVMILAGNPAEAADVYLGEYETGQIAYLDTTSIRDSQTYKNGELESNNYDCYVKALYKGSDKYEIISYEVIFSQSVFLRKNGNACYRLLKEIQPYYDSHPVEKALVEYISRIDRQKRR